jgi:phospholipase/carboxylesterase
MLQTELAPAREIGVKDLLVVLHGLGDSMEGYRWVQQTLGTPRLNILLVNAPDAYYGGFSWYDYAADAGPGVERSYRLLEGLLDKWREKGYPTERTVLFGFSQGCLMSIETGIRYPHRLAGIIGVSGYVHEPDRLLRMASPIAKEQKFLITHGTDDPLIPFKEARRQFDQLKAAGMHIEFHSYPKVHTIIEPELALFRRFLGERLEDV